MESTDQQILSLLASDGRMSYTDIGRETGLSTSAAQQRVRRLEQRGVITGYRADFDNEALGKPLTSFISVKPFDPAHDADMEAIFANLPAIRSCYSVAGDASYLLEVCVANPAELEEVLQRLRNEARCSTHTSLVLSVPFRDRMVSE